MFTSRLRFIIAALFLLTIFIPEVNAQYYTVGNDPAHARWRQLKSEYFTLIYPSETDSLARLYLSRLEYDRPLVFESTGAKERNIPVVLHPYTTLSNGTVTWAPRRIDLFTSPDAYRGTPDPWISQLTTHELRHQAQMEIYSEGVFNVLYYPFGESLQPLGAGVYVGSALMEGDAVISETELLGGGRGRSAEFLRYYRMASITGDDRNYYRYDNGSYRYYTPNKYAVGYFLAASARKLTGDYYFTGKYFHFGVDNWINLPKVISPYKNTTGSSKYDHWTFGWKDMGEFWKDDLEKRGTLTTGQMLTIRQQKLYTEYVSPKLITDSASLWCGEVITIKSGFEESGVLIAIDTLGKESFIHTFGSTTSDLEYASDGKLWWTERKLAGGSTLEDWSVLKWMDLRTGKIQSFPDRRTKWFNPSASPSGETLAVTEYPVAGSSYAVLIDTRLMETSKRIEAPDKGQIKETAFIGEVLYATVIKDCGLGIYRYGPSGWEEIIPQQNQSVSHLQSTDSLLYFCSDLDGVQNIYTLNPETQNLTKVTNSAFGVDYPFFSPQDGSLYCSEFGAKGFSAVIIPEDSLIRKKCSFDTPFKYPVAEMLLSQRREQSRIDRDTLTLPDFSDRSAYPSRRYSRFAHLFRFHSWAPFYYNVDNILTMTYDKFYDMASLGAVAYSQNTLGTAVTMFGYSAHTASSPDKESGKNWFHSGHAKFTYKGICPYIEASVDFNDRHRLHYDGVDPAKEGYYYNDTTRCYITDTYPMYVKTSLRLYYPIYMSGGGWTRSLIPQVSWNWSNDEYIGTGGSSVFRHQFNAGLTYTQIRPLAHSQLYPRWGFSFTAATAAALWDRDAFGQEGYLYGYAYLPGVTHTQGIKLSFTWQKQFLKDDHYLLSSMASMPKGYRYSSPTADFIKGTVSYAATIYLGDAHIGWDFGLYLKRLEVIPFYEWARDKGRDGEKRYFSSVGGDLLLDFRLLPIALDMSIGVRYARIGDDCYWTSSGLKAAGRNTFQFLFNIGL